MKRKVILKNLLIVLISLVVILMLTTTVKAKTSNLEGIKSQEDYIFYVEGYEWAKFQFAFTNESEVDTSKLQFINNWTDNNGSNVACLDREMKIDMTKDIFIWIQNEKNEMIIKGEKIDLSSIITKESMTDIENLTKLIKVDSTQKTTKTEEKNGIKITKTTGKLVITDSKDYTYKYSLMKAEDSVKATEILAELDNLSIKYKDMTMIEKIKTITGIKSQFEKIIQETKWNNVKDMTINQPEKSVEGDKYVVFLQKLKNDTVISTDMQILKCFENEEIIKETEEVPVKVTTKLPVTGEDVTLYIVLGIIILVIIAISIRMVVIKLRGKDENK